MDPFWRSFSDQFKTCGRNPTLFLMVLAAFLALVALGAIVYSTRLHEYLLIILPGSVLFFFALLGLARRRARARRRPVPEPPPLSRDEIRVARSKLLNEQK